MCTTVCGTHLYHRDLKLDGVKEIGQLKLSYCNAMLLLHIHEPWEGRAFTLFFLCLFVGICFPDKVADKKVAGMELDMVADIEVDKIADIEVDMVADMEVDMVADMVADIDINMEIQFGERVSHGGWLIGPKLFRSGAYLSVMMMLMSMMTTMISGNY